MFESYIHSFVQFLVASQCSKMTEQQISEETSRDKHNVIDLFKKLSSYQCLEYLTSDIKQHATKQQYDVYPSELQQLSIKYLGFITVSFIDSSQNLQIQIN